MIKVCRMRNQTCNNFRTDGVQGGDGGWLLGWVDFDLGCYTILLGQ